MNRKTNRLLEQVLALLGEGVGKVKLYDDGMGFMLRYGSDPQVYDSYLIDTTKNGKKVQSAARNALMALKDKISSMDSSDVFKAVDDAVEKAVPGKSVRWNSKSYPD
jgi:hypothetical protein